MTELDAINRMLRYIGELPVPSSVDLTSLPEGHEALIAQTVLGETLREEQENKMWFNYLTIEFVPDNDGYITLPDNIISFESDQYLKDGGRIYDKETSDTTFTQNVELPCLLEVSFDNIPDVFRTYVVLVAAQHLHTYLNGDETTQKELETKINIQRIKVEKENLRQNKYNLVRGTRLIDRGTSPTALI